MRNQHDLAFIRICAGLLLGQRAWYTPEELGIKSVAYIGVGSLLASLLLIESPTAAMRASMGLLCATLILVAVKVRAMPVTHTLFCRAIFAGSFAFLPWAMAEAFAPTSFALDISTLGYGLWMIFSGTALDRQDGADESGEPSPSTAANLAPVSGRPAGSRPGATTVLAAPVTTGPSLGSFKGQVIHEWIVVEDGRVFYFERTCSSPCVVNEGEVLLAPGLIYALDKGNSERQDHGS